MVVKLHGDEGKCCIVGAGKVIPEITCSVQIRFFQFNIDGFLNSPLKPSVFSVQNVYINTLERVLLFLEM